MTFRSGVAVEYMPVEALERTLGMHNIHQNQGDPAGSQWWNDNGIWQDGGRSKQSFGVALAYEMQ
jgi:uncharacterized protein YukJ